jgi:maltooligosyltrehalose trehalohydrolase
VILDVVYNHVGASGVKAMEAFGPYFTEKYETPWGRAINFDDRDSDPVREWVLQSAEGWVRDFHVDGLRLDAIHSIVDSNPEHLVAAVARRVHAMRPDALVIAESGLNDPKVVRAPDVGGYGCDAAWADDFHHALRVLLTGDREGYYAEFGTMADLGKALSTPHVHDGRYSAYRRRRFGAPTAGEAMEKFVVFSQNHDQVGNRAYGDRLPPRARRLAAFCTLLLSPYTPMLFMGEEYGEPAPFQFFSDHIDPKIAKATREGRRREFAAFKEFGEEIPDPQAESTFLASKLTRERDPELHDLYAELIAARRMLPRAGVWVTLWQEEARTLTANRGGFDLLCNFGGKSARVACGGDKVLLATHGSPQVEGGGVELEPLSGALIG